MKEAGDCHCKVLMETVVDNSDFSFLIKYNYVSVLCKARSLSISLSLFPFLSHTHTYILTLHPHLTEIPDKLE